MAEIFDFEDDLTPSLGLADYISYVSENVDVSDVESIKLSSQQLYSLSKNKEVLNPILLSPLKEMTGEVQANNVYTDASFILGGDPKRKFFIRANVWKRPVSRGGSTIYENRLYSYFYPHDHNFDFLTVGYLGPGYRSLLYTYDKHQPYGVSGEEVDIKFIGDVILSKHRVMFYEKSVDVHSQIPPEDLSISINLMVPSEYQIHNRQYEFDIEKGRIKNLVRGFATYRKSVLDIAGQIGDPNMVEPLIEIIRSTQCVVTKSAAISALAKITPDEADRIMSICGNDDNPLVKVALQIIENKRLKNIRE